MLGAVALKRTITGAAGKINGKKDNLATSTALCKRWGARWGAQSVLAHPPGPGDQGRNGSAASPASAAPR